MGSLRGGGGNNSDFQSELLRMNGSLQSSITELRYHCEVYRLSLRSICKVLVSVQKEQDARLRYLTTARPSFHAYLLNLSQKQALDRIRNVVRKASTFINGYSLVDKNLFQPPPPKPSTVQRTVSCDESKKTAPAPNTSNLMDGLGRVSEGYSGGGDIGAVGILAVIAEEDEGDASANKKENDDAAEKASSKNNSGKVERKHHSGRRLRKGGKERKKKTSVSSSKKSKSRSTKSKRSHGHSSAGSEDGEIKKHGSNSDDESNDDDDYNEISRKEIKRMRRENKKVSRSTSDSNRFSETATLDHSDSTNSKQKDTERKKPLNQTRSQSITPTTRGHDNYHHHHRHRHQVINSRTPANHQEEARLDDENVNKDASFANKVELNKRYHKQQSTMMSQSKSITNRIPSLFSISTSTSTVSSVVIAMRRNKTSATSFLVSEKFRADARRGGGLGIRRPSSEKLVGQGVGSNANMKNAKFAVEKDCRSQNHSNRNISAICMKDRYESKTTRAGATTRRWGNGNSTLTAFKAGYKVRESLAVVRNRNSDGTITAHQGQGGVGATRRYLFSSQRPRNNFKLSSICSSAIVTEKVRRIQVNGNCGRNSFCGGINEDKVYGANRKSVSSGGSGSSSNTNVGVGSSGITARHNAPS